MELCVILFVVIWVIGFVSALLALAAMIKAVQHKRTSYPWFIGPWWALIEPGALD
jgi:hypothetical protein